jgi:hypothetical protein
LPEDFSLLGWAVIFSEDYSDFSSFLGFINIPNTTAMIPRIVNPIVPIPPVAGSSEPVLLAIDSV